jgi:hypothetical protein
MAHHRQVDAIVLNVDERWCGHDPSLPIVLPFPFWLYRGDLEYLANLLSTRAITFGARRIKLALGLLEPDDPRGYQDYETGHVRNFRPRRQPAVRKPAVAALDMPFPAFDVLDPVLAELPAETSVVFEMSPVYQDWLDELDPQMAADLPRCKAEFARRAASRPRTAFLDYLFEGPISRDADSFMDTQHFRLNVARIIETNIAGPERKIAKCAG